MHDKCFKYLMGSQAFAVFRAFVDQQWLDGGLFLYLLEPNFRAIIKAMPRRNRRDVIGNMCTYAKSRMPEKPFDQILNTFNDLIMQIETLTNP